MRVWFVGWLVCVLLPLIGNVRSAEAGCAQDLTADIQAVVVRGLYERAESLARVQVDTLQERYREDSIEVATASDCLLRALLLNGRGAERLTLELAEKTLRTKETLLSIGHADLVPSLLNLGDVLVESAQYKRAIETLERAVALRETAAGVDSTNVADALDRLGAAMIADGRYDAAIGILERSLRIKESLLDPTSVGIARTLEAIAAALQGKGSYERSQAPIRRAAAIQARADAADPAYAETLNLLGLQYLFEGDLVEARAVATRAVAIAERTLRPGHPKIARYLKYLAGACGDLGDLRGSRVLRGRALAIAETSLGPDHHETAGYLIDLANVEIQLGGYPAARTLYERALKIAEARLGPWHDRVATAVYNLAWVHDGLGDYKGARQLFVRAIGIWEHVRGRDHPFVAVGLSGLARIERENGSPGRALPLLERALAIRERSLGAHHRQVARTLVDLATTMVQVGRAKRARELADRALRIWEALDTPVAVDLATAYKLYADLQVNSGDPAAARRYYERALTITQQVFGVSHPGTAEIQIPLAFTSASLGEGDAAFRTAVEAERSGREHLGLMVRYLPERESLNYAAKRPRGLDLMLSLADAVPGAHTSAFDAAIRARGLVFDEMALRRTAASNTRQPELASLAVALASARQRLANLIVRNPSDQHPQQYLELIAVARTETEAAERALAEKSSEFRVELERQGIGFEQVRQAVPPGSAVVSIVRYHRSTTSQTKAVSHYVAFVLVAGRAEPNVVQLGAASTIERAIARWRTEAGSGTMRVASASAAEIAYRAAGERLRRLVWDPLVPHLGDIDRVFIVPDGALNLVNLGALPVGATEYLVERRRTIHYLSTERDLVTASNAKSGGSGLLALGGPNFDDAPLTTPRVQSTLRAAPCGTLQSIMFGDLPGTLQEATEVAGLWKAVNGSAGGRGVQLSVANQATERAFKQQAPGRRVLHLATHGFFLGGDCEPSAPATRAVGRVTPARAKPAPRVGFQNPLLVSGLALAGANQRARAKPDQEDGVLTAEEISAMNLQGTEWAVLSACDTGLGEVKAGEGVFGLRRAFQIAGVRTVIMSLWSVEDEATRLWMRALYDARLNERLDTAESVRAASLRVLRDRRAKRLSTHPFYWGAFVAAGAWQ
jgi:CHAT domain-containing protein/tetratricopeptide (TPR) repeat protein